MYFYNHTLSSWLGFFFLSLWTPSPWFQTKLWTHLAQGATTTFPSKFNWQRNHCWLLFGLDPGFLLLRSNKPLNHWPFQQQVVKQPAVSPEVTDGGTEKQVSLFKWLWFPNLESLLHIYQQILDPRSIRMQIYTYELLLSNYTLDIIVKALHSCINA